MIACFTCHCAPGTDVFSCGIVCAVFIISQHPINIESSILALRIAGSHTMHRSSPLGEMNKHDRNSLDAKRHSWLPYWIFLLITTYSGRRMIENRNKAALPLDKKH